MTFEARYQQYRAQADQRMIELLERTEPQSLYGPTRCVLEAGGKRVRAVLVMLAAEAVGGQPSQALDAGVAVEILHNFTLVHDDIMDRSATRRGQQTVHTRWDEGTAILVGDDDDWHHLPDYSAKHSNTPAPGSCCHFARVGGCLRRADVG